MAKIGELIVKIGADMTSLTKGLEESQKKMQNFGNKAKAIGGTLTAAVTLPLIGAAAASVKLASDMSESINKIDVAFQKDAKTVEAWAGTTLKSYGIAKGTALDMAATFGDMSTSMGLNTQQAADMSMKLVGLAGDLASFKNISIEVANTALNGVFTGETESLKQLGIVMTQANLQEFAYAQGIKKKIQDMTQAEQVQLRYNYVLAMTNNAQGDFQRTGAGAANQMRIFNESLKELGATLGTNILPLVTPVITKINEWVQSFAALDQSTQKTILIIAGIAAALGPILILAGSVAGLFASLTTVAAGLGITLGALLLTIGGVAVAVAAAIAIGVLLYKNWDTIMAKARELEQTLIDAYVNTAVAIQNKTKDMIQAGKDFVAGFIQGVFSSAKEVAQKIKQWFSDNVIQVAKNILGIASPSKVMADIGQWAAKGLALGLGSGSGEVVTQAQLLADAVTSIKQQIQQLNAQYEISYYATGANSDATKQLREQIAELAKQYDNLTTSIGSASNAQQSLQQRLMGYAGSANSDNADYTAALIGATIENEKIDWSKSNNGAGIGIEVGGRWAPVIGSYASGTDYVPKTGLYKLHQGEKVVPSGQNQGAQVTINIYDATDPQKVGTIVESKIKTVFRDLALGGAY